MREGGYKTNSWKKFKDEFNYTFRTLANYGYAVFFLGHQKESVDEETGKIIIRPAISPKSAAQIIEGMADIYGYAHQKSGHNMSVLTLRHEDETISCGGRIKYLPNEIEMSYENLTTAMKDAIEKEAMEHNNEFITEEKDTITEFKEYDYNFKALCYYDNSLEYVVTNGSDIIKNLINLNFITKWSINS